MKNKLINKLDILALMPYLKDLSKSFQVKITCKFPISINIDFMEILEIWKGKVLFNEGDKIHNLFYTLEGSYEISKTIHTHKTKTGAKVDYITFEPSEEMETTYKYFWKANRWLNK